MISSHEKRYAAEYVLNPEKSVYDSIILYNYRSLVLTVSDDHFFSFNKKTPFFTSTEGHWEFYDDGDFAFIKANFYEGSQQFQLSADSTQWIFESYSSPLLKNGQKIVFSRSYTK